MNIAKTILMCSKTKISLNFKKIQDINYVRRNLAKTIKKQEDD